VLTVIETLLVAVNEVGSVTVSVKTYVPMALTVTCASAGEVGSLTLPVRLLQPTIPAPLAGVHAKVRPVSPSGSFAVASVSTIGSDPPLKRSVRFGPAKAVGGDDPVPPPTEKLQFGQVWIEGLVVQFAGLPMAASSSAGVPVVVPL
jgi:hypothetical protein